MAAFQAGDRGIGLEAFDKRMEAAISRGAANDARQKAGRDGVCL
jgi:hypothetical protein